MDIKQTYRYNTPGSTVDDDIQVSLEMTHFNSELHLAVLADTSDLLSYEIYELPTLFDAAGVQNLLYKWISTNGYIPSEVKFIDAHSGFSIVPSGLRWNKNITAESGGEDSKAKAHQEQLDQMCDIVHFPDFRILSALQLIFPNISTYHYLVGIWKFFSLEGQKGEKYGCLYMMPGKVGMLIASDGQLQAAFEKSIHTKEDVLYFTLAAYKQYGMDPMVHTLFIGGYLVTSSPVFDLLQGYISEVRYVSLEGNHFLSSIPELYDGSLM